MARSARRASGDGCGAGCAWVGIALLFLFLYYFKGTFIVPLAITLCLLHVGARIFREVTGL